MSDPRAELTTREAAWLAALEVLDAASHERGMDDLNDGTPYATRIAARTRLHDAVDRLGQLLDGEAFGDVFHLVDRHDQAAGDQPASPDTPPTTEEPAA